MNTSSRVLHVITGINRGGAENHLFDLVRHQRDAGMEITVAYLRGNGYWSRPLGEVGVEVRALALRFYGDPRPFARLRKLIACGRFDLIHAHLPPAELYVRLALLSLGEHKLPLIISKHNDCPFHRLPGERIVGRWVARRAAKVIAISNAVQRYMTGPALGLPLHQVERVHYGVDAAPFERCDAERAAAIRRGWGAGEHTLVIGFMGRLVSQKSIDTLIHAFALFAQRERCDTKLVIVGAGELEPALRQEAAEAGVAEQVVWAGFREDVPDVMHAFDVFALSSIHEGFGLVLVEAMAARKPVVATRAGAIPEVVVDGETGFLVEPQQPDLFAEALARLMDPELRARLGAAGCRRAFERFTLERMWQQTDALYARCLRTACVHPAGAPLAATNNA